ncbi:MAG: class B sortase [Enterocloster asparagiformis]|nr:class B sortase [Enterocloster asparagiformis]
MKDKLHRLVIIVLALVLVVSAGMVFSQWLENKRARDEYNRLAELASQTSQETGTTEAESVEAPETEPETEPYISPIDFDALRAENPDTIGWITIDGTNINYPIVQGTDNDFYLNHDFNGQENIAGAIYLDFESQGNWDGRNNIIYGHNMKNGSMFKDVVKYKDEAYFKEHQFFTIYTPEREIRLKSVAAYYGEAKPIVRKTRFKSQESFDAFVKEMLSPCTYAEPVQYPARTLYTLVTCSYEIDDARTFLFAVEVDEDGNEIPPDEEFQERQMNLVRRHAERQANQETVENDVNKK